MRRTGQTSYFPFVLLTLLLGVWACTDTTPLTSPQDVSTDDITEPASNPSVIASVTCTANVKSSKLSCGKVPVVDEETGVQRIIVGGQGVFVELFSPVVSYDSITEIFQADVYLRNYITQGLGSPDGLTPTGIRVFTHSGPTVTSTTPPGAPVNVTVANADGTGTFTGAGQPYHLYAEYLPAAEPPFSYFSSIKTWEWNVPKEVDTFIFEVYVDADVVAPNGYVLMSPKSLLMSTTGGTQFVSGTPYDYVGRMGTATVTYTSSDPAIADVNVTTGEVTALSAGTVNIIGTTGGPEADGVVRVLVDPSTTGFDIDVQFITPVTATQALAFTNAAARWQSLITGDLPTEQVTIPVIACGGLVHEYVDDLAIRAAITPIDGPSNTLGFAAYCWVRSGVGGLPAFGIMVFDSDDVGTLETNGQLEDVVLHEMGHVLGIGTLWDDFGLLQDDNGLLTVDECFPGGDDPPPLTTDPFFNGPNGVTAFANNGGGTYAGNPVPVENDFGSGTRCVHWRESVLDDELMTGFAEAPMALMPLSEVTVKSLADMGYTVAASGWDAWLCPACAPPPLGVAAVDATAGGFQLVNDVWLGPVYSRNEQGEVIEVRPDRRR